MKERKKKFRIKKKYYYKVEKNKKDLVNKLHWDVINNLLKNNDVVYFGNIKSHDIVKDGKNLNDLKFYQFKQRLLYKAYINAPDPVELEIISTGKKNSSITFLIIMKSQKDHGK